MLGVPLEILMCVQIKYFFKTVKTNKLPTGIYTHFKKEFVWGNTILEYI